MSRWKFVFSVIYRPWKGWVSIIFTIIGLYDLFISQFISNPAKNQFPILADIINGLNWSWYIWLIIFLSLMVIFIFEGAYRFISVSYENPKLKELVDLRIEGVQLRNQGNGLLSENSVETWINKYSDWENKLIDTVLIISPSKAGLIKTLDKWVPQQDFPNAFNERHRRFLLIFDEKLKRLGNLLEKLSD